MTASHPAGLVRADLTDAVEASRIALSTAERELHRSVVVRSRAAQALERTARQPGLDEDERARRRADYAAADRAVTDHRSEVERARELARAAKIVAAAFESATASAGPVAAALIELVGPTRSTAPRVRAARATARRATSAVRLPHTRPRTA